MGCRVSREMGLSTCALFPLLSSERHLRWEICVRAVGLNQEDAENRLKGEFRSMRWSFRRRRSDGCRWFLQNRGIGCRRQPGYPTFRDSWRRRDSCISCRQLAAGAARRSLLNADGRVGGHSRVAHCHLHHRHRNRAGRQGRHLGYEQCDRHCNRYEYGSPSHNCLHLTQCRRRFP